MIIVCVWYSNTYVVCQRFVQLQMLAFTFKFHIQIQEKKNQNNSIKMEQSYKFIEYCDFHVKIRFIDSIFTYSYDFKHNFHHHIFGNWSTNAVQILLIMICGLTSIINKVAFIWYLFMYSMQLHFAFVRKMGKKQSTLSVLCSMSQINVWVINHNCNRRWLEWCRQYNKFYIKRNAFTQPVLYWHLNQTHLIIFEKLCIVIDLSSLILFKPNQNRTNISTVAVEKVIYF